MPVVLLLWICSNWISGVFSPEIWKNYLAGATFFSSSLRGWLSCSELIGFPIPWVIFKLPLLTCHRIVQRQCRHSGTNSKISLSFALQLCFCPQLLALACNTTLRSMVTTCAGKSRHPSTQQGPKHLWETVSLRDGVSALTLGFLAGTCLCVVRLESFTGKSLSNKSLPSFFKIYFQ